MVSRFKTFIVKEEKISLSESSAPWMGIEHLPRNTNSDLRTFLELLLKYDQEHIYLKTRHKYNNPKAKLTIKITDPTIMAQLGTDPRLKDYNLIKNNQGFVTNEIVNVELYASAGLRGSGRLNKVGDKKNNPTNDQQESGTIYFFKAKMEGKEDPTIEQISKSVGFEFNNDWYHNFKEQWEAFYNNIGIIRGAKIHLDSGKNDSNILIETAKKLGLKDSKDNWNPADIWIMTLNKSQVRSQTKDMVNIAEFNGWLKEKFNRREIIGVSLKKVAKNKKGKFSIVNENTDFPEVELKVKRVLFTAFGATNFIFETQGSIEGFNIRVGAKAKKAKTVSDINIFSEGRMSGTSVQLGAVSAKIVRAEAEKNRFNITTDKQKIFADPLKYIEETMPKILKHPEVQYIDKPIPAGEVEQKMAAYLTYFMYMYLSFSSDQLRSFYFSAAKMNDFSSIHCKLS